MSHVKIDIENLVMAVETYFDYYEDYVKVSKVWKYDNLEKQRDDIRNADKWQQNAWDTVYQLGYVLCFSETQMERLFACAKAVRHWRKRTDYMKCMSCDMKKNIADWIFGKVNPDIYWGLNQREIEFV